MGIQEIKNPRLINSGAAVMLDVLEDDATEYVPFVAMADDITDHGRKLFEMAVAGDFGEVVVESV